MGWRRIHAAFILYKTLGHPELRLLIDFIRHQRKETKHFIRCHRIENIVFILWYRIEFVLLSQKVSIWKRNCFER